MAACTVMSHSTFRVLFVSIETIRHFPIPGVIVLSIKSMRWTTPVDNIQMLSITVQSKVE